MEPITLTHLQGKAILSDDTITLTRSGFSGLNSREIPLSQISAIRHTTTMMGGALAISLQLDDATTVDLKLVTPVAAARQFVAAVETSLAARTPVAATIIEGAAVAVASEPASPAAPAPQIVVVAAPIVPPAPPEQMIKIYRGPDCAKHFQKEAKKLARKGWRVQSQSYGGQTSKAGAVLLLGPLGFAAGSKPNELTVVYERA